MQHDHPFWPYAACALHVAGNGRPGRFTCRHSFLHASIRCTHAYTHGTNLISVRAHMHMHAQPRASASRCFCAGVLLGCSQLVLFLLPRPPASLSLLPPFSSCEGDAGSACYARDGIPADDLESEFSSRLAGRAYMRYLKPMVATAFAGWWALCAHRSPVPAVKKRRMSWAAVCLRLKKAFFALRDLGGLRCNFLFPGVVCAKLLGQRMFPVWCLRVCTVVL